MKMIFNFRSTPEATGGLLSIAELKPGQRARVLQLNGHGAIRQRLMDMGLMPETAVEIERVAPSGDPLWIKLLGYQLSLRRSEAATVLVAHWE